MAQNVATTLLAITLSGCLASAKPDSPKQNYSVVKAANVGGDGGFDYLFAEPAERRLYIPRNGTSGHLSVFDLDTLEPRGQIAGIRAGGAVVDPISHHGFSTTKPITMWDSRSLDVIKTIAVDGRPDGILFDRYNERIWILSHIPPYATIIDGKLGTVVGTLDLGGAPEQAVSDNKGTIYINISDKANVARIDAKSLRISAHYDVSSKASGGSGLALDSKNHILFAYYRNPSPTVVILDANKGNIITTLPTGTGVDTATFNPVTSEAVSAENAGSMTFIKEITPTNFVVEQTLQTMAGAKTITLDAQTGHLFTMTARFEPAPADAMPGPSGRPPRGPMIPGSFTIFMVGR